MLLSSKTLKLNCKGQVYLSALLFPLAYSQFLKYLLFLTFVNSEEDEITAAPDATINSAIATML